MVSAWRTGMLSAMPPSRYFFPLISTIREQKGMDALARIISISSSR